MKLALVESNLFILLLHSVIYIYIYILCRCTDKMLFLYSITITMQTFKLSKKGKQTQKTLFKTIGITRDNKIFYQSRNAKPNRRIRQSDDCKFCS